MKEISGVGRMALVYLLILPLGQLLLLPLAGAAATLSDLVLGALVLAGVFAVLGTLGGVGDGRSVVDAPPGLRTAFLVLLLFGVWVGLSGLWGFHPGYAGVKGLGVVLLVVGAYLMATAGVGAGCLADAWLLGAGASLAVTFAAGIVGPASLADRVLYGAGLVDGLPFPRVRGPFTHPNLFGGYLAVSGLLLWARWPAWRAGRLRTAGVVLALLLILGLGLSVSTGWLVAGGGVAVLAFTVRRWGPLARGAAWVGGVGLVVGALAGAAFPLTFGLGPIEVRTGGIRPQIWSDAAGALLSSPLVGVGAAPYLAETADPILPEAGNALWDAHSTYLSVLGQFGVVGGMLFFGGLVLVVRAVASRAPSTSTAEGRLVVAFLAAAVGILLHWITIAGEDFRHLWALLGVVGAVVVSGVADPEAGEVES